MVLCSRFLLLSRSIKVPERSFLSYISDVSCFPAFHLSSEEAKSEATRTRAFHKRLPVMGLGYRVGPAKNAIYFIVVLGLHVIISYVRC